MRRCCLTHGLHLRDFLTAGKAERRIACRLMTGKAEKRIACRLMTGKAEKRIARCINGICGRVQETDTPDFSDRYFSHLSRFIMDTLLLTVFPVSGCS